MSQLKGTVKWFNASKGYGFVNAEEDTQDIFVHYSSIEMEGYKTLKEGEPVEFEFVDGPKGPQAHKVKRLSE